MPNQIASTPAPWTHDRDDVFVKTPSGEYLICSFKNSVYREAQDANLALVSTAPELLEALTAFEEGLRDGSITFTKKRQSDSDPYHRANVLMCAAFAKLRGEE